MQSMAIQYTHYYAFSPSPQRDLSYIHNCKVKPSPTAVLPDRRQFYDTLGFQAAKLLGPPARFEASNLKVVFMGEESDRNTRIMPRTYAFSHCDFTANLTLTISNIINRDQLKGWYNKDDVLAEWTRVNGNLFLDVHCYVSGPNRFLNLAAEFRYYIFSKELLLVLEAVLYGDSDLFREHQELMDALVRVFFHSTSKKYDHVECWGPLKDAAQDEEIRLMGFYLQAKKVLRLQKLREFQKLSIKHLLPSFFNFMQYKQAIKAFEGDSSATFESKFSMFGTVFNVN